VTEHEQNYTSFIISVMFHKTGGGEEALIRGEALILNFGRQKGRLFEGGAYLRGGANSRIYGMYCYIFD